MPPKVGNMNTSPLPMDGSKPFPRENGQAQLQTLSQTSHPASNGPEIGGNNVPSAEFPPMAPYPAMAVDTDPMTVLRLNFNSLSHLVENVFSERNHQIACLKSQNESLRLKISNDSYELDRLTSENSLIKSEIERITLDNERLKVELDRLHTTNTQCHTNNQHSNKNNSHHNNRSSDKRPEASSTVNERRLHQMLDDSNKRCGTLERRAKEYATQRDQSLKKLKELENSERSTIDDLRELTGGSDAAMKTQSVKRLIGFVRVRIGVLQKRVEDESKKACQEAQRAREFSQRVDQTKQELKVARERSNALNNLKTQNEKLKKDMAKQKDTLKRDLDQMKSKAKNYEKQIQRVLQIAGSNDNKKSGKGNSNSKPDEKQKSKPVNNKNCSIISPTPSSNTAVKVNGDAKEEGSESSSTTADGAGKSKKKKKKKKNKDKKKNKEIGGVKLVKVIQKSKK